MTPSTHAKLLFSTYGQFKVDHLSPLNCRHAGLQPELESCVDRSSGVLSVEIAGHSLEGRTIPLVKCGAGPRRVLLWSQMHGDEPTATLALMDMLNLLAHRSGHEEWIGEMLEQVSVYIVPMLNPDGAERRQRRSPAGIDINRDAKALVTPEANLLRNLQRKLRPRFGFNLHDQELSSVGNSTDVTAIALLAPALDERRTMPQVRIRAMRVAAFIARTLSHFVDGHLARYDDAYEPRAFGDNMQAWGTSTVLVESGHWPKDRGKSFVRKLNYVALLAALRAIGNGSYEDADLDHYATLPENGKRVYDLVIRNVLLEHGNGVAPRADIGLNFIMPLDPGRPRVVIKDVGDLHHVGGLEELEGGARRISPDALLLESVAPLAGLLDELQLYYEV